MFQYPVMCLAKPKFLYSAKEEAGVLGQTSDSLWWIDLGWCYKRKPLEASTQPNLISCYGEGAKNVMEFLTLAISIGMIWGGA